MYPEAATLYAIEHMNAESNNPYDVRIVHGDSSASTTLSESSAVINDASALVPISRSPLRISKLESGDFAPSSLSRSIDERLLRAELVTDEVPEFRSEDKDAFKRLGRFDGIGVNAVDMERSAFAGVSSCNRLLCPADSRRRFSCGIGKNWVVEGVA